MSAFEEPGYRAGVDEDFLDAMDPVPAEYRPKAGAPVQTRVIFREARGTVEMRGPGAMRAERVGAPSFYAKGLRHVLAGAREGESLVVKGTVYTISGVAAGTVGLALLTLQGPVVERSARQAPDPTGGR